jgi:protein TonB
MPRSARPARSRRLVALALSAAIHIAALAALLLWHLSPEPSDRGAPITVVDLPDDPVPEKPKPPPPTPKARDEKAVSGAPAPAGPKAEAAPLAMAIPVVVPTLPAAILPATGVAASAGAATSGSGTGAGGAGDGTGGGGDGSGTGTGGRAREGTDPVIVRGSFRQSDYPKELRATGPKGVTWADVVVGVNGRVTSCRITKPSGIPLFDAKTCQILFERFRYRPARDAHGRPVAAPDSFSVDWDYQDLNEE